ncbi:MAG TPA: DUF5671 domain-containing protein [Actinotalea sp.]|nr:DUF5671 domain-containing protein [Actinotalea sp.]
MALAVWTRRRLRDDPGEARSLGWAAYLGLAGLTAAVVSATAVYDVVAAALVDGRLDAQAVVQLVVWGAIWAVHWALGERTLAASQRLVPLLLGSLIGLATSIVGLVALLAASLDVFVAPQTDLIVGSGADLGRAAAVVVAGGSLWTVHWLLRLSRAPSTLLWLGYVLVVGVGVSTVMTVAGASVVLYRTLVWLLGEPETSDPALYLQGTSVAVAVAVVGGLSWWYHREILAPRAQAERTEVTRVYEYLLSAVALLAAAVGVVLVIVALVEAISPEPGVLVGPSLVNTVLAAVTLLAVGGPLWWAFWHRIERTAAADPVREATSPTRRAYLFVLFGIAGLVAVVVVLVAAFIVIEDALAGTLGAATLHDIRVPLGMLVAAGTISGYHWLVYRADRRLLPATPERRGPHEVLLVGPRDEDLAAAVRRATGARVDGWVAEGPAWDVPQVLALLGGVSREQVLVVAQPHGAYLVQAGAALVAPAEVAGSAADAGDHGDEPGAGGQQGQAQLEDHPQPGGLQGDPGGVPRARDVPQA